MKKNTKRLITYILIFFISVLPFAPSLVLAEDIDVNNEAESIVEVDSEADTGENTIQENPGDDSSGLSGEVQETSDDPPLLETEGSCSPTPVPSTLPSSVSETNIDNSAEATDNASSLTITGDSEIDGLSSTPSPTPEITTELTEEETEEESVIVVPAIIDSGDAASIVDVENDVNSTSVNSEVVYHTLNIFVPEGRDVDLTKTPLDIANKVFTGETIEPEVSVAVTSIDNFAYVSNDIVSRVNTGGNRIEGFGEAAINTGDAYSVVSVLNNVNTSIIDSAIHIVSINIFAGVDGNIILPEFDSVGDSQGGVVSINNNAALNNSIDSYANTGSNSAVSSGSATIRTGNAQSVVNVLNVVNKTYIDTTIYNLIINNFGNWAGSFLGWNGVTAEGGQGEECTNCSDEIVLENEAQVVNNISSSANTGNNEIDSENGTINTGDSYSAVSVFNFVNTSFIRTTGLFGFINIFGSLDGDIGGASFFESEEIGDEEETPKIVNSPQESQNIQLSGGELSIYQTNNVGTHVESGDTITFFVTVRNPGTGPVYGAKLRIGFINEDGIDMGGATFDLGDIQAGRGQQITTGITLSNSIEAGNYIAHAVVSGYVGPDNTLISAFSDSFFEVKSKAGVVAGLTDNISNALSNPVEDVLAASTDQVSKVFNAKEKLVFTIMGILLSIYIPGKIIQNRIVIAGFLKKGKKRLISASLSLRSFLASILA